MKAIKSLSIASVLLAAIVCITGCGSSNAPNSPVAHRMINENDSSAVLRFLIEDVGIDPDQLKDMDIDEMAEYVRNNTELFTRRFSFALGWSYFPELNQRRVTYIMLIASERLDQKNVVFPKALTDLEEVHTLDINGGGFNHPLPEDVCKFKKLRKLCITYTDIPELPENLFNENMEYVAISGNSSLRRVPTSVLRLDSKTDPSRRFVIAANNSLSGKCPAIKNAWIWMNNNNFDEIDWESISEKYLGKDGQVHATGPMLYGNRLYGEIPENILSDTVRLINYYDFQFSHWQSECIRPANMPSEQELEKMRREYINSHPDDIIFATPVDESPGAGSFPSMPTLIRNGKNHERTALIYVVE